MRPSISLSLVALLFFFQCSTLTALPALDQLCEWLGGDYISADYCINTLKTDPSSVSADVQGLGVIAINLTITNATAIESKLEELLKNVSSPPAEKALKGCHQIYLDMIPSLRWAANSMASKLNRGATAVLYTANMMATSCGLLGTPLTKEINNFTDLCHLAYAIAHYLAP